MCMGWLGTTDEQHNPVTFVYMVYARHSVTTPSPLLTQFRVMECNAAFAAIPFCRQLGSMCLS